MTYTLLALLMLGAIAHPPSRSFAQQPARSIEIHARRFQFEPSEITLKKGEPVTLRLISDDVPHSLVVRDLKINQEIKKDHPAEITVTPESAGDYRGQCGRFCGSGHGKMKFTIHVTE